MDRHEINIYIKPRLGVKINRTWFKDMLSDILFILNIKAPSELGLVITDNEIMQQLNKLYRNKDKSTDVLTFPMLSQMGEEMHGKLFVNPPDGLFHLGEIIISFPKAKTQARNKKHDIKHEFIILMTHGVLHLLGYDHELSKEDGQRMRIKEDEIITTLSG
ncbi:rRNA maturation RNase YbeY [Chloroflexota bacterium]